MFPCICYFKNIQTTLNSLKLYQTFLRYYSLSIENQRTVRVFVKAGFFLIRFLMTRIFRAPASP